jgi:hypothetical protein
MMEGWSSGLLENGRPPCFMYPVGFLDAPSIHSSVIPTILSWRLTAAGELGRVCALFEFQWRLNNETYMASFEN